MTDEASAGTTSGRGGGAQMTLVEHLTELRRRMIISVVATAVCAVVVFALFARILDFLSGPYAEITKGIARCGPDGCDLIATSPVAPFLVRLKVAGYGGMTLAIPVIAWQVWRFIVPGLHPHEKRYAVPFIVSAVVLFVAGCVVAWFSIERALQFLLIESVGGQIEPFVTADAYLSLVTLMFLAFGIAFQFPLLLVFLLLARIVSTTTLKRGRRWAAVGITTFAAVITPTQDPFSLMFMVVPLYLFYEIAILIGRVMKR